MDPVHKLVTRRFKELRSQGVSTQEAMKRARGEFQPSEEHELDPGSKGTYVRAFLRDRYSGSRLFATVLQNMPVYCNVY